MRNTHSLLLLLCALVAAPASAEVLEVERGYPLTLEDAYPLGYLGREFRTTTRYQRGDDGSDEFRITTEVEIGFPRNGAITVSQPFILGNVEPDGVGNTEVEFLYNLNQETRVLPAFAVGALAEFPTNDDAHGTDPGVELVATKTLPGTWHSHRVHLNLLYQANDEVQPGERGGRYMAVFGYSVILTNEMLLVADIVREQTMEEDEEHNLAEVGLRYQLTPRSILSGGLGFGFGDESPDTRATFGLQIAF